ncbi:MAG: YabP/YqfC family sporulation protein [Clostridia bacterium]|nr:YabP/YqfC family sporulation protein [Clostridia bacterium]
MKKTSNSILAAPPLITISGTESVKIENTHGVKGFNSDSITIKVAGGMVLTEGDLLEISYMQDGVVVVQGKIRSVSFA